MSASPKPDAATKNANEAAKGCQEAQNHKLAVGQSRPLQAVFLDYCKIGEPKHDPPKLMNLVQSDRWLKDAKLLDGKIITTVDTGICFKKQSKNLPRLNFEQYKNFVTDLAKSKNMDVAETENKLACCSPRNTMQAQEMSAVVERLTDVTKYTGCHRQRYEDNVKRKQALAAKNEKEQSHHNYRAS